MVLREGGQKMMSEIEDRHSQRSKQQQKYYINDEEAGKNTSTKMKEDTQQEW